MACTDHLAVLEAGKDGAIVGKLDTGAGVDNLDYLPARRLLYAAAGGAATLTVARLDPAGALKSVAVKPTARGARNAVVAADGTAFIADGAEGKVLVVAAPSGE